MLSHDPISGDHTAIERAVIWRLIGDAAASSPTAVSRAADTVDPRAIAHLQPSAGRAYALMVELAAAGVRPTAEAVVAAALRGGHLHGAGGDALKRVLIALVSAPGDQLTLLTSAADAAGVVLRARAESHGHTLAADAATLGGEALIAAIRRGQASIMAAADAYEAAMIGAGQIAEAVA